MSAVVDTILSLSGLPAYALIALLVGGEAAAFIGIVLPGEAALLFGGVLASQGRVSLPVLLVVSALLAYAVGRPTGIAYLAGVLASVAAGWAGCVHRWWQ